MNNGLPWQPDLTDGTYKNPVLFADYSDPDVIRVGEWFYMTSSSFNCTPGLPVLRSADLVNWEIIGHALKQVPHRRYKKCLPGCGVWAPSIRYHENKFFILFPTPDEGLYVVETEDPSKEWSEPHLLLGGKGLIDPCPLWDDDGKAYIIHAYAFSRAGKKSILRVIPVSPDLKGIRAEGRDVISAMGRIPTLEGPKFYKHEGKYYILAPAGGVPHGWQMVFRSDSVYGPYEEKTVLAQRGSWTNGPHQGSLVDDTEGNWWFLHFQDYQPWGRIVHLQPAYWEKGWPLMGTDQDTEGIGRPVQKGKKPASASRTICHPASSDDFLENRLGLQWQWNANFEEDWYDLTGRSLLLNGEALEEEDFALYPRILTQKINSPAFSAAATVSIGNIAEGDEAGLTILGLDHARLGFRIDREQLCLVYSKKGEVLFSQPVLQKRATFFVTFNNGGLCRFGYLDGGERFYTGPSFQAKEGQWIGARFGLYCLKGEKSRNFGAEVHSVRINDLSPEPAKGIGT